MEEEKELIVQHKTKPPRPFSSNRIRQANPSAVAPSQANIQRLLKTNGSEDDPLADERNQATSQTELHNQSDFLDENSNQYFVTKFREGSENGQRPIRAVAESHGQISKASTQYMQRMSSGEIRADPTSRVNVPSHDGTQATPMHTATRNGPEHVAALTSDGGYNRRGSATTQPASAGNQNQAFQFVNPCSPTDGHQTQGRAQVSSFIQMGADRADLNLNSEPTVKAQEQRLSTTSMQQAAESVLPSGVSSKSPIDETSVITQETRVFGHTRNTVPSNVSANNYLMSHQRSLRPEDDRQSSRSKTASDGQKTVDVPTVTHSNSQLRIQRDFDADYPGFDHREPQTLDANITAQILTGEVSGDQQHKHFPSTLTAEADRVGDGDLLSNRMILTDSQSERNSPRHSSAIASITAKTGLQQDQQASTRNNQPTQNQVMEQVQSAEFAMSTFNILNNQEVANAVVKSGENQTRTSIHDNGTDQANQSEIRTTSAAAAAVQRQHILSGTRQLKQSTSVLDGHVTDTMSQQHPEATQEQMFVASQAQSKTVMDQIKGGVDSNIDQNSSQQQQHKPNRPVNEHFGALSLDEKPDDVQVTEQVIYNRLPKDYFMQDTQEQMDIDIAINDIKQLRQGFISYVNDQGVPEEEEINQIDDFLDPQKFIDRHFGVENPDIIFQEVITSVPEPIPETKPEQEYATEEERHKTIMVKDGDDDQNNYQKTDPLAHSHQNEEYEDYKPISRGGFAEENVTPAIDDFWGDTGVNPSESQSNTQQPQVAQVDNAPVRTNSQEQRLEHRENKNFITGETFLKDARQIDTSINQMNAVAHTVNSLNKPFNDNEMAQRPENVNAFKKMGGGDADAQDEQTITIAIESRSQEAMINENQRAVVDSEAMMLGTFDTLDAGRVTQSENRMYEDPVVQGLEDIINGDISQQRVLAINNDDDYNMVAQRSQINVQPEEIDITRRKKKSGNKHNFDRRKPVKILRMADYFKTSDSKNNTMSAMMETTSKATAANDSASNQDITCNQDQAAEQEQMIEAEQKWRDEIDQRLEQDILDNVDVNFIFNKGLGLTQGLIDQDRIFSVMNKLKELAYKQLQSGSSQINYNEIVNYLKNSEGLFADDIAGKDDRSKVYAGERDLGQTESVEEVANEPALIGLGTFNDEKDRRWSQCMTFLRNNPKLLLQMIPNPDDDDDMMTAIPVGRPRRKTDRRKSSKPAKPNSMRAKQMIAKIQESEQNKSGGAKRFLASSGNTTTSSNLFFSNRVQNQFKISQRQVKAQQPIKVRANPIKSNALMSRKVSESTIAQAEEEEEQDAIAHEAQEQRAETIEDKSDVSEVYGDDQSDHQNEVERTNSTTMNIKTKPGNLDDPAALLIDDTSMLQMKVPETTKAAQNNLQTFGYREGDQIAKDQSARKKRQKSAVTRPTNKFASIGMGRTYINSNSMLNSMSGDLQNRRLQMGSGTANIIEGPSFKMIMANRQRLNAVSAMQPEQQQNNQSFATSYSGGQNTMLTTMQRNNSLNQAYPTNIGISNQQTILSSLQARASFAGQERNNNTFYYNSKTNPRNFKSSKQLLNRVLSQGSYRQIQMPKRPTTAVQGPSLTQAHGIGRRRLASNSILQFNAQARSTNRQFMYNKDSYQTSGVLMNVESQVKANLAGRGRTAITTLRAEGGENFAGQNGNYASGSIFKKGRNVSPEELQNFRDCQTASAIDSQGRIPSIFRQSNEFSALSAAIGGQEGHYHYLDGTTASLPAHHVGSMITTCEAASQTLIADETRRSMEVQTEIKDVRGDLSPAPKPHERSVQSHFGMALQSHVDWAYSPLCIAVLKKETKFNKSNEKRVFVESEVEVVLQMLKTNFQFYQQTDMLAPFHAKALETLKVLLKEQSLDSQIPRFERQYLEITIENTLKVLLRSKLVFSARVLFIEIYDKILRYEMTSQDAKHELESKQTYKLPLQELNELRLKCGRMYEAGEKVIFDIKKLRADRKGQYSQPFIFKKKDLTLQIKNEIAEVRQLLKVYRQKRRSDSEDSEKPTRFKVESGDEVSEREEVRDSNYVGTDLYWENRFYQVKPFKPPEESGNEQELLSQGSVEMQDGGKTVNSEDIKDKEFVMV